MPLSPESRLEAEVLTQEAKSDFHSFIPLLGLRCSTVIYMIHVHPVVCISHYLCLYDDDQILLTMRYDVMYIYNDLACVIMNVCFRSVGHVSDHNRGRHGGYRPRASLLCCQ